MIDSGDTAWVLAASALVLLMTPGLAFFYGGLVRRKNIVSTIMYSFVTIGLVGIVWVLWDYSLAFGPDIGGFIGNLEWFGLKDVSANGNNGVEGLVVGEGKQIVSQLISMGVVLAWGLVTGFALFLLLKFTMGVRATQEEEFEGLDITEHGLPAYGDD